MRINHYSFHCGKGWCHWQYVGRVVTLEGWHGVGVMVLVAVMGNNPCVGTFLSPVRNRNINVESLELGLWLIWGLVGARGPVGWAKGVGSQIQDRPSQRASVPFRPTIPFRGVKRGLTAGRFGRGQEGKLTKLVNFDGHHPHPNLGLLWPHSDSGKLSLLTLSNTYWLYGCDVTVICVGWVCRAWKGRRQTGLKAWLWHTILISGTDCLW